MNGRSGRLERESSGRRRARPMSAHARRLQSSLEALFNEHDRKCLIQILTDYHTTRSLQHFVRNLSVFIDTPVRRQFVTTLRRIIPHQDRPMFDAYTASLGIAPEELLGGGNGRQGGHHTLPRSSSVIREPEQLSPISNASLPLPHKTTRFAQEDDFSPPFPSGYRTLPASYGRRRGNQTSNHLSRERPLGLDNVSMNIDRPQLRRSRSDDSTSRIVVLRSHGDPTDRSTRPSEFGFDIAQSTAGPGLFVSNVEPGTEAELQGLITGDRLVAINKVPCTGFSLEDAVELMKKHSKVCLTLATTPASVVNGISALHQRDRPPPIEHQFTWIDAQGRPVSPPIGAEEAVNTGGGKSVPIKSTLSGRNGSVNQKSGLRLLNRSDQRKVNLRVPSGSGLGASFRGGAEYGLGIYVAGVDPGSVAEDAGIKVGTLSSNEESINETYSPLLTTQQIGDKVLDVNGTSFLAISHNEATKFLRSSKSMILTVQALGKLPYARSGQQQLNHSFNNSNKTGLVETLPRARSMPFLSHFKGGPRAELPRPSIIGVHPRADDQRRLEDWTSRLLTRDEQALLWTCVQDYQTGRLSIDELIDILITRVLDTGTKFSLLTPLRPLVRTLDIDRFDLLVLKAEIHATKSHHAAPAAKVKEKKSKEDIVETSSSYNGKHLTTSNRRSHSLENLPAVETLPSNHTNTIEDAHTSPVETNGHQNQDNWENGVRMKRIGGNSKRRIRSTILPEDSNTMTKVASTEDSIIPQRSSAVFNQSKRKDKIIEVIVNKNVPTLGMTIEGGANTAEPLPRIVDVRSDGAAAATQVLQAGMAILEVDGVSLEHLDHLESAKRIATAFRRKDTTTLVLKVTRPRAEPGHNPHEATSASMEKEK